MLAGTRGCKLPAGRHGRARYVGCPQATLCCLTGPRQLRAIGPAHAKFYVLLIAIGAPRMSGGRLRISGAELAQMVVEVAITEDAPRWTTQRSEERVLRPRAARPPGDESRHQGFQRC
jgi:hypothetical protein